jgi:PPM family protein phosphatase
MVNVVSFSEAGGHLVNEDAFAVERHPADPEYWLCCLADGQGGRAGGARAAQLSCQTALAATLREPPRRLAIPSAWYELLRIADEAVRDDSEAGYATLMGFCISEGHLAGASCGDSAVLVATAGQLLCEVTADQAKNPPVGSGGAPFHPFAAALVVPWKVLAMTDGVWKYAGWEYVKEAVTETHGQQLVERLQQGARLRGSGQFPDDFTVVLFEKVRNG